MWEVRRLDADSKPRAVTKGDVEVCVTRLRDKETVCVNRRDVVTGFGKVLPVSKLDLTRHGLAIKVRERGFLSSNLLARAPRAVHTDIRRAAICLGLVFRLQSVERPERPRVDSVRFYLDPPGLIRPPRCPR